MLPCETHEEDLKDMMLGGSLFEFLGHSEATPS